MKLFIVHAGYYDSEIGIYELHTNFLVAAADIGDVKKEVNKKEIFRQKNMHIDAIQEIEIVDGYKVTLIEDQAGVTKLNNYDYSQIKRMRSIIYTSVINHKQYDHLLDLNKLPIDEPLHRWLYFRDSVILL